MPSANNTLTAPVLNELLKLSYNGTKMLLAPNQVSEGKEIKRFFSPI